MKVIKFLAGVAAAALITGSAFGQTVGIGTTKGGATAQVSAGISKIVSEHAGFQMRPQPMGGTQQYIPVVNAGELEFGISNMMQAYMAFTGTGLSEGQKNPNLRMVATMMTFRTGLVVAKNSGIDSVADLKGKRVPSGFKASPLFQHLMIAMLANGGLSADDVNGIPVTALRQHWDAFKQGKVDVVIAAVGSAILKDLEASIPGGVKYISFDTDEAATNRTLKFAPRTFLNEVTPAPNLVGVEEPVHVIHFEYSLWANKDVDDDTVYKVTKAMFDNEDGLHELSPLWRSHASKKMGKDQGSEMPYHPGAIKFYQEAGVWRPATN